jgi:pyruvate kinase
MNSSAHGPVPVTLFKDLIRQVESLRLSIERKADSGRAFLQELPSDRYPSAQNLLHYLAMRSQDIRPLQDQLARLGMSSLGRAEAHVMATINAVLHNLQLVSGHKPVEPESGGVYSAFESGEGQLELNTLRLFGQHPENRREHIIVTVSAEAAQDYLMVHTLLTSGMNCMRLNCVHDSPDIWARTIEHLRNAEKATGLSCRVLMDLGGPKLRLGPMEAIPSVMKVRPARARDGRVLRPARIWLTKASEYFSESPIADASLVLDADWLAALKSGDRIRFVDNRGSKRTWKVRDVAANGCWAEAKKTAYLANGITLTRSSKSGEARRATCINSLEPIESISLIRHGDMLFMSLSDEPGTAALHDETGDLLNPGRVSLAVPEVYRDIRLGEPVYFDDGRISGIVEKRDATQIQIRITHTRNPVEKLEGRRGINLPETSLDLPALSAKDERDLEFAVQHADIIGLSFTNSRDDVRRLGRSLARLGREDIGVILKIETKTGFSNLPTILLEALKFHACGIMIARGDLAVECGFERLSEVQEEILWVCESAHVPVVWATQVLERLTKGGHVTRAEVTDAAASQAAEAVMLNKGPFLVEAVEMLDDILQRMQGHHRKKHSMMRELQLASGFHSNQGVFKESA